MKPFAAVTLTFSVLVLATGTGCAHSSEKTHRLIFYHVNDTHGSFYKSPESQMGGFAILSTLVKSERLKSAQSATHFFLTSGGDVNTGTPESDLMMAEPDFRAMNALDFDAMVVGNHEFDRHWKNLEVQQGWAEFPFLAANIRTEPAAELPVHPYIIKEKEGLRVAFLGLTTEHSRFLTVPAHTQGLIFDSAVETARYWVPRLRKEADIVVVLSHLGWCQGGTCAEPNDVTLARSVPGIDLILGGHSHSAMERPDIENGTYIFQAAEKNQKVGVLEMEFRKGKLYLKKAELRPLRGEEDPAILQLLEPLRNASRQKLQSVVGRTPVLLDGERIRVRSTETNLGNLLTLAFRQMTKADLALINGGGIRASIPAGAITYGDIHKVVPFFNTLCTVEFSGQELREYMEKIAVMVPGEGNFPQMSGVSLKTDTQNKIVDIKINNKPLLPNKSYKVVMNNYMAEGGDFYPNVKSNRTFVDTGLTMDHVLRSYIEMKKVIRPQDIQVRGYYQRAVAP